MKKNKGLDDSFVYRIQPQGGIDTRNEYYTRLGNVYLACVHVYEIPDTFTDFWLKEITSITGVTVTVDYFTNQNLNYKKRIEGSVTELEVQRSHANTTTERDLIDQELDPLRDLSIALNKQGEVIKQVHIRVYVYASSLEELNTKVNRVIGRLDSSAYQGAVFLDENADEYQSMFLPMTAQRQLPSRREGLPLSGQVMGLGFAHNQTSLADPYGSYFGYTPTGGTVYWDMFRVSQQRTYYNTFLSGDLGSGKSTSIKKMLWERAIRGDMVRVFDRSGEFADLVHRFRGTVINLDGSQGRINMFQVYPTAVDEKTADVDVTASYRAHIGNLSIKYRLVDSDADARTASVFGTLCDQYYKSNGYLDKEAKPITSLASEDYPTLSDIVAYIEERRRDEPDDQMSKYYNTILLTLRRLATMYGQLFDGYSSLPPLQDVQLVSYQLDTIDQMEEGIQDLAIYNAIMDSYNNCMAVGRREKKAFDHREKTLEDVQHWLIIVDECHTILNTDKAFAADFFVKLMSEGRKMFGAIVLATQRLERMFPNGSNVSDRDMVKAVNSLNQIYSLCQYKVLLKHDVSTIQTAKNPGILRRLFGGIMTEQDFATIPNFDKGECYLLTGPSKLHMQFQVTDDELRVFAGGA
ncbi:VirB4 family type IV secretion system protein [Lacticaseibacillus sp. 866-1]|uniref:VirB4 family type IV secretion system protein n=1 Tax=Lacticaseibacillus sp. 866-1 TaxID=2799576 RepID=UPI001943F6DC|nr:ATP-binding protein [Lacticaseibacillus sp. 866-1]